MRNKTNVFSDGFGNKARSIDGERIFYVDSYGNVTIGMQDNFGDKVFRTDTEISILDELLPRAEQPIYRNIDEQSFSYDDIKRIRVAGRLVVRLPSGRLLAKALDRKQGKPIWVPFGRKEAV